MGKKQSPKLPTNFLSVLSTAPVRFFFFFPLFFLELFYKLHKNVVENRIMKMIRRRKCKLVAAAGMKLVFAL